MTPLLERITEAPSEHFRRLNISSLNGDELLELSKLMKLSLSKEDMLAVQKIYADWQREPTDVELEVIAQTWSEHCRHRIFDAKIEHTLDGQTESVDSLFKTYIYDVTNRIIDKRPDFVLSCFHNNAGFIKLDDELAIYLKTETHNHPSAIEPYAGTNTGLGGVIGDNLGVGKGAKPIASLDVFCFGPPDTKAKKIKAVDVTHPLSVMHGVVRDVRDYGNRTGIPTVSGAIQFDNAYIYNPLVYCGTAGVIPIKDIDKEMPPDLKIISVGAGTGRDGLHGATVSLPALDTDSHKEDQQAADFVLTARDRGLIVSITDCGAGGYSSACGELLEEVGGTIALDNIKLKEPGMVSWEIFISESQERMVLAIKEEHLPELQKLADTYETELTILGDSDGSGILKVTHHGETVCELDCSKLHKAPTRHLQSNWARKTRKDNQKFRLDDPFGDVLKTILSDFAIVSREPIIREYNHEALGNTVQKPLDGASGDAPQDASVLRIDGSDKLVSMSVAILPEWGKTDPYAMGVASVDECYRQLVASGSNPNRIAILDNFCVGNPEDHEELGALVETVKGIAKAAETYSAPFVSGNDSFYNYFETDEGPISIPVTILISGMGVVEDISHVTSASLRSDNSVVAVIGMTCNALGGSVLARKVGLNDACVPSTDLHRNLALYRSLYDAIKCGWIRSAHDVSEGGLAVALAEMGFSGKAGIDISLDQLPLEREATETSMLFSESPGRLVLEINPKHYDMVEALFGGQPFGKIGTTTGAHQNLKIDFGQQTLIDEPLADLKSLWKNGLVPYY